MGGLVMTARKPDGEIIHCDASLDHIQFDETFWMRYAELSTRFGGVRLLPATAGFQTAPGMAGDIINETLSVA